MSTTVVVNAGELAPEAFVQTLISKNADTVGFVQIEKNKLVTSSGIGAIPFDTFIDLQKADQEKIQVWHLGDQELKQEDLLPFTVEKGDSPEIVAFLSGKFENYKDIDLAHTPAANCFNHYMRPMILEFMGEEGGDVDKTMKVLNKASSRMNFLNAMSDGDHIVIVASNGEVLKFSKNKPFVEFSWGCVSDTLGYEEKKEAKPVPKAMTDLKFSLQQKHDGKNKPADKPKLPDGVHERSKDNKPKFFKSTGKKPDGTAMTVEEVIEDYRVNAGTVPKQPWKRPEVRVSEGALGAALKKAEELKLAAQVPEYPLMEEKTIKNVKHFMQEINKLTDDPAKAQDQEQDFPYFSEATDPSLTAEMILHWTYSQWLKWTKAVFNSNGPQPIAMLFLEIAEKITNLSPREEEEESEGRQAL